METEEASPGEDRFHADPPKPARVEMLPKYGFLRPDWPEIHMSGLARQDEMTVAGLDQSCRAKARAESDDELDARLSREGADRDGPGGLEDRQTERLSLEIIEEQALIEASACRDRAAVDDPIRIGHLDGAPAQPGRRRRRSRNAAL